MLDAFAYLLCSFPYPYCQSGSAVWITPVYLKFLLVAKSRPVSNMHIQYHLPTCKLRWRMTLLIAKLWAWSNWYCLSLVLCPHWACTHCTALEHANKLKCCRRSICHISGVQYMLWIGSVLVHHSDCWALWWAMLDKKHVRFSCKNLL